MFGGYLLSVPREVSASISISVFKKSEKEESISFQSSVFGLVALFEAWR